MTKWTLMVGLAAALVVYNAVTGDIEGVGYATLRLIGLAL